MIDLETLKLAFNKTDAQMQPWLVCADLNHIKHGPFRVNVLDLDIFKPYFNKPELGVPECDQPPIYTGPYNFWIIP
jgi:hypothetical protein